MSGFPVYAAGSQPYPYPQQEQYGATQYAQPGPHYTLGYQQPFQPYQQNYQQGPVYAQPQGAPQQGLVYTNSWQYQYTQQPQYAQTPAYSQTTVQQVARSNQQQPDVLRLHHPAPESYYGQQHSQQGSAHAASQQHQSSAPPLPHDGQPAQTQHHEEVGTLHHQVDQQATPPPLPANDAPPLPDSSLPPLPSELPPQPFEPQQPPMPTTDPPLPPESSNPTYPQAYNSNPDSQQPQQPAQTSNYADPFKQYAQAGYHHHLYPYPYQHYQQAASSQPAYVPNYAAGGSIAQPHSANTSNLGAGSSSQGLQIQNVPAGSTAVTPGLSTSNKPNSEHSQAASQAPTPASGTTALKQSLEALRPVIDINTLLRRPGRMHRPSRMLIVLRGLPGSGKSYLAKRIREVETEEGGDAPRIHALDDYFMTEVEREVEEEGPRGKPRKKTVTEMEYQYDADMEDQYRKSLVKSVCRTLGEGRFQIVIMDAPNMKLSDFVDVMPFAQKHHYTVYVQQPLEMDPALCAKRDSHGRGLSAITQLSTQWQSAPTSMTVLDAKPLLQGKLQGASHIEEVDMDQEATAEHKDNQQHSTNDNNSDATGDGHDGDKKPNKDANDAKGLSSRWSQSVDDLEHDHQDGEPAKKRAKVMLGSKGFSYQGIMDGIDEALRDGSAAVAGDKQKSAIKKSAGGGSARKRVKWCDQPPDEDEDAVSTGFRIQPRILPLCEVHVLQGLGPAKGDTAIQYMDASSPFLAGRRIAGRFASSFAAQVKEEHELEHTALTQRHPSADPLSFLNGDGDE